MQQWIDVSLRYANDLLDINELVKLMQQNYTIRNLPFRVSYRTVPAGNVIVVDNQDPSIVKDFKWWTDLVSNTDLPDDLVDPAKIKIRDMKFAILEAKHKSEKDRQMFVNADVVYIQFTIGGLQLVNYMIE